MKGGGLTWVGWAMIGVGGMLVYAGMTGTNLVDEIAGVLQGRGLSGGTPDHGGTAGGSWGSSDASTVTPPPATPAPDTSGKQQAADKAIPWPMV